MYFLTLYDYSYFGQLNESFRKALLINKQTNNKILVTELQFSDVIVNISHVKINLLLLTY